MARVQLSTWRTAYADLLPADALNVPEEKVAALWLNAIEAPPTPRHRVLVAMERIHLVGFAVSTPADDEGLDAAATAELSALLVEPRWGRRGHGSRLVAASVELWRAAGFATAVIWTWERDPATRAFLTGSGWEPDGAVRGLDTGAQVHRQLRFHTDLRED